LPLVHARRREASVQGAGRSLRPGGKWSKWRSLTLEALE